MDIAVLESRLIVAEPEKPPSPAAGDLAELMRLFNASTEQLKASHEKLQARVAELSRELEEKNRELRRKNRLAILGEMAACMAHEIRNPLGGIELYAGLLRRDVGDDPDKAALADKLLAGSRHLNALVTDMLAFTNGVEPRPVPGSPRRTAGEALDLAMHEVTRKRLTVDRRHGAETAEVPFDPELIRRVLLNLVLNAAQAMAAGGTLTLETSADAAGARWSVADTGPGLSDEAMEKLFTPFYTNKAKGTGLGLALAHRIVEAHGGRIEVENRPGTGARFTVVVPRK